MLLMEELLVKDFVQGKSEREILAKRFMFRANGCVFVYTSSVPDDIHEGTIKDDHEDATRYTLLFSIICFKTVGNDLVME